MDYVEGVVALLASIFSGAGTWLMTKREADKKIADAEKKIVTAEQRVPHEKVFNILFDGIRGSGKTTFLSRLVCPVFGEQPPMTTVHYKTEPLPICWNRDFYEGRKEIFSLRAYDISGENDQTVIDALNEINQDLEHGHKCVLILMWDLSPSNYNKNKEQLTKSRLKMGYQNKVALDRISDVIVFLNKVDICRQMDPRFDIGPWTKDVEAYLSENLKGHGQFKMFTGSAQTGEGVHSCYGHIVKAFDLERHFVNSPVLTMGPQTDPGASLVSAGS